MTSRKFIEEEIIVTNNFICADNQKNVKCVNFMSDPPMEVKKPWEKYKSKFSVKEEIILVTPCEKSEFNSYHVCYHKCFDRHISLLFLTPPTPPIEIIKPIKFGKDTRKISFSCQSPNWLLIITAKPLPTNFPAPKYKKKVKNFEMIKSVGPQNVEIGDDRQPPCHTCPKPPELQEN